jgi:hypothetical protein
LNDDRRLEDVLLVFMDVGVLVLVRLPVDFFLPREFNYDLLCGIALFKLNLHPPIYYLTRHVGRLGGEYLHVSMLEKVLGLASAHSSFRYYILIIDITKNSC